MKKIYYENSSGNRLDLMSDCFNLQTGTLFNHTWEYTANGIKLTGFERKLSEKELTLTVAGSCIHPVEESLELLSRYTETDILNRTPGKLYYGESYLKCYLFAGELSEWEYDAGYVDKKITLVTDCPFWITESQFLFFGNGDVVSAGNKQYPNRYKYRYVNGRIGGAYLINDHFSESKFRMIIYGPVISPLIIIGDNQYMVNVVLQAGEYLRIDSVAGTIYKIGNCGEETNVFNSRDKTHDVFQPVLPGKHAVEWSGKFDFEITIFAERSEPVW